MADEDNKVIALSGKWGTGKSHMWAEVQKTFSEKRATLYASLFGLSGVEQIKMKLLQSAVPAVEANPAVWKGAKQAVRSGVKILEGFHKSFGALNDVGLIFAPAMLRQKLIVLDDIERKHDKLNIDEVLGFIDEFTQQHGSRFLLILNSDQLDDLDMWNVLREKVVDQELRLNTSSAEAFNIAIGLVPSPYAERIRKTVETCGLTNIRIIRKIIKAVNQILGDREEPSDAVLARVIPSTVLLAAIHYKGIEDGPDFDFVLSQGTTREWRAFETRNDPETEDDKRKSRWNLMLSEVGIHSSDDFELLIVELLQSGLFDVSKVAQIIDRYVAEADVMNAQAEYRKFVDRSLWEHTLSEAELLAEASTLAERAHLLDAYTVTALHEIILELQDGQAVADRALCNWIHAFKARNLKEVDASNFFRRKLHPSIEAEFNAVNAETQANTNAFDACIYVAQHSGWNAREELAMKSATAQDMEAIIRTSPASDLRLFMLKMMDLYIHKGSYVTHFGAAMDNFVLACPNIVGAKDSGRLGRLIRILFNESKLGHLLDA